MMTPEQAVLAAILACVAGAGITLLLARWRAVAAGVAFVAAAASATLTGLAAGEALTGGTPPATAGWLAARSAWQGLRVDGLSAAFLLLTAMVSPMAALYSLRYLRRHPGTVARYYPYFLLLLAAIYGLLATSDTTWWLLIFWQLIVFAGYALIRFDRSAGTAGANRFVIMLELACAAVLAGSGLLARGDYLAAIPAAQGMLPLVLMLLGFGITLGLWPFGQMWLPHASAAAPAPVSALLAGVIVNLGAYGLLRYFLFSSSSPAGTRAGLSLAGWGTLLAAWGTVTLFAGTMQGLQQDHCRRLLAFHSIGQMGYVLLAIGTCMTMAGRPGATAAALANIALLGGLLHVVNHSLFASLLHLNAGSVLQATGTEDLNRLGGLMKYMPLTGLTALVGSLAISGVPLLNGFASKWAIFVAAIQGAGSARYLAVCGVIAILTGGLTLASFLKFFGTSFLSRTSKLVSEKAGLPLIPQGGEPRALPLELGWSMQAPQLLLAFLCVLLGLMPGLAFRWLQQAAAITPQGVGAVLAKAAPVSAGVISGISAPQGAALFVPLALLGVLITTFLMACAISRLGSAPRRVGAPWLCGYAREQECGNYVAQNFYGELKRHFRWMGGVPNGKAVAAKGRTS